MIHFLHLNGSVETTPPKKRDTLEIIDYMSHESNVAEGVNRLAYKAEYEHDPYKYKYELN